MAFHKAKLETPKLRMAFMGPPGCGKTYAALVMGKVLGKRVALIDTERGSAKKLAGRFAFDVAELSSFEPKAYVDTINDAERSGYDVLILDSLSHAWAGKDGVMAMMERAESAHGTTQGQTPCREITRLLNDLMDTIFSSPCHIIATMRCQLEHVLLQESNGDLSITRVGLGPIQCAGVEYEFDIVVDIDRYGYLDIAKSRYSHLHGQGFFPMDEIIAETILRHAHIPQKCDQPATDAGNDLNGPSPSRLHGASKAGEKFAESRSEQCTDDQASCSKGICSCSTAVPHPEVLKLLDTIPKVLQGYHLDPPDKAEEFALQSTCALFNVQDARLIPRERVEELRAWIKTGLIDAWRRTEGVLG